MKRIVFPLFLVAITIWCSPGFAARQSVAGAGTTALDADGILSGVDMSASGGTGTLTVGVLGGVQTDIFTNNNPVGTVAGLAVSTDASSTANIVFNSSSIVYGNLGVTNPGGPFFLNINAGANGSTVTYLGSVFGTTIGVTGTGTVNFNSGATNISATNFAGDGIISLSPNTTLIGALTTSTNNTGTLSLGSGSVLNGAVGSAPFALKSINVVGGSNIAGVTSTITGAVDAYNFSLGTNTLNITGALTIANTGAGGTINTTLASPTVYGNISPIGATNLGPTVTVNVLVPSTAYIPVGTQFNIVKTRTGTTQSGTDGSLVAVTVQNPTNPLYTFAPVPLAGTIAGLVTIRTTGIPLQAAQQQPVAAAPVTVLLALPDPPPDLTEVLAAVNAFTDPVDVINATTQLSPLSPALSVPLLTFQGGRQFNDLWLSRLDMCSHFSQFKSDNPDCREDDSNSGWWAKGFGRFASQDARGGFTAYDSQNVGAMVAYDVPVGVDTRAGLGLGYGRSVIEGKTYHTNTSFDTYQATAYIGHEQGPWFLDGDLSFGWNEYSGMRHIVFTGVDRTANAKYSGQDYTAYAQTGYHIPFQKFVVTPLGSLQYSRVNISGYAEKGAGDINLKVNSQQYDFLESGLGAKIEREFEFHGMNFVPEIHFKWLHELMNPTIAQTATFDVAGSSSFTTPGLVTDGDTYNVGAGLTLLSCGCGTRKWSLEGVYDYDWKNDGYDSHQVTLRVTHRF
jgi:uncharacterized protein with beta-barrel porin domain